VDGIRVKPQVIVVSENVINTCKPITKSIGEEELIQVTCIYIQHYPT
jgi:hypothetical protein